MKKSILFGVALSFLGASTFASEWNNLLSVNHDDYEYFFDAASVEKSKNVVTIWMKSVRTYTPNEDGSWSSASRWRMNCQEKTLQTLARSSYDADGKFMKSHSAAGPADVVIPDSIGEGVLKTACMTDFPTNTPATKTSYFKLTIDNNDVFAATKRFVELRKSRVDSAPK